MAKINDAAGSVVNEQLWDFDGRNYFNDGLADDDSWVENTSQGEEDLNEFDDIVDEPPLSPSTSGGNDPRDQSGYSCHALDFTLHTIVEESCEDSELEFCYNNKCNESNADGDPSQRNEVSPTDMERYFVFGFEDRDLSNNCFEDSSSEIFSDLSDSVEQELITTKNEDNNGQAQFDLSTSRLEKYFLSEFMGFSAENKSDSSVGSDSEGKPSPSQRKKKLRARRTPRSNHSSFDNLLVETAEPGEQSNESLDSSESDIDTFPNEVITCDKLDNINSVKRKKNYRKRELHEPTTLSSSLESSGTKASKALVPSKSIDNLGIEQTSSLDKTEGEELKNEQLTKMKTSLGRTDSFNNWSSDEETNIMMSKMRQFFKTLIAVKTNNANSNNCCIPTEQQIVLCKTKAIQFPYFESELIRLMKTVPGINNQQLREIVEYLSSEDTWSDSNDSSDFNASNVDAVCKNGKRSQDIVESIGIPAEKSDSIERAANNDNTSCFLGTETALMYSNLFESFMVKNSKISQNEILMNSNKYDEHHNMCKSLKTEQLLVNIWQHIGQKLVNLMREDSIGADCVASSNTDSITEITNSNVEEIRNPENAPDNVVDCSIVALDNQKQGCLPRSKSHDILLGTTTNRSWHSYSNSAVNDNTGETSDGDRFSWRGSFESALLAPGDSRNKLLISGRENGSSRISQWSLLKRGSVDNLWCTNVQNRKHLDRVQSCGSILGNDEIKCLEIQKMWLSTYMANKSDEEASFTRTPHESLCTNSLPGLQSIQYAANISNNSEFDQSDIQASVKSARYRSPAMQSNTSFTSSAVKRNESQIRGDIPYVNSLHKNITSSSSLGDFSLTELNSNINTSPVLQRKSLYKRNTTNFRGRSESLTSVCSEYRYENVKVKGQVEFGMQYNYKINALEIHIVQCKDLASVSSKRFKSDPYVKVYILPDLSKCGKRKTKVKKQTLNPVFNETLRFHVPISKLKKRSIWLTVWNSDLLGRNDFLGEVLLDLEDKVFDKPQSQWYTLQQKSGIVEEDSKYRGNLVVALKFIPNEMYKESSSKIGTTSPYTKGKLHILVKEAKYLYSNRNSGTCDTFCKSYLLPIRTKSTKQKTHVIKKSFNPMWNFTFVYEDLTINELSKRALELTVWDHDRLISNQFIGGVRFSLGTGIHNGNEVSWMESNDKETFLWREMMNRPNFWVEGSVKLRSNINDKREDSMESRQAIQTK